MIEQYIYNKITADVTLQGLLTDGAGGYKLYPGVIPRDTEVNNAITFTTIITTDIYPSVKSKTIQLNIFSTSHTNIGLIAKALSDLFNEDNNQSDGGESVVFSIRKSESDLGKDYDDKLYQREATYYFKLR